MKTLRLPIPPSVNAAYGNRKTGNKGRGRYKTRSYKVWEKEADVWAATAGLFRHGARPFVHGPAKLVIRLPVNMRGDIDNRCKPTLDWLVDRGFTRDDSTHQSVTAMRDPALGTVAWCEVDISSAEAS